MKRTVMILSGALMVTVLLSSYTFATEASDAFTTKNYFIGKLGVMQPVGDMDDQDFDIAILDIMGVNGYGLLDIANSKKIPAVMLTAHAFTADIDLEILGELDQLPDV